MVYMMANLLLVGFFLDDMLIKVVPNTSPMAVVNRYLIYYFGIDLILRFYFQNMPLISVQPLLHLPIRKNRLVTYLLNKTLPHPNNLAPLFIIIPFALEWEDYAPASESIIWLVMMLALTLTSNFFSIGLKKQMGAKNKTAAILGAAFLLSLILDYFGLFDLSVYSEIIFSAVIDNPLLLAVPILIAIGAYSWCFRLFRQALSLDHMEIKSQKASAESNQIQAIRRLGTWGELLALELKLIWRNKRTKSVIWMSAFFLLYGLIFFPQQSYVDNDFMIILVVMLMNGMFLLNYGQFLLGWQGNHFDALLANNIRFKTYYKAKFMLFLTVTAVSFVLTLPYGYFGMHLVWASFAMMLFNIGVNSFVIMFFGSFNPKRIDLSQSSVMNWQGVGASQFLVSIPIMVLPFVIYTPFALFGTPEMGYIALGVTGAIGLALHNVWLNLLEKWLQIRKYDIAERFRQPD